MATQEELKEYMLKEIDIIQEIIKRMAHNSFLIKSWAITLIVATLLLKGTKAQVFIAFIPLIGFWYLDAYFLRQERLYRKLYAWVVTNRLTTDEFLFNMNATRFNGEVDSEFKVMKSITLKWFYGSIAAVTVLYMIVLMFSNGTPPPIPPVQL